MQKDNKERGSVTLEASIVLPIFIFVFLFIYGLFSVIGAQNQITHATVQAAKSLSMDSYLLSKVDLASASKLTTWGGISDAVIQMKRSGYDDHYVAHEKWFEDSTPA